MGIIVGLSGLAGAGKDTVADLLVNDFRFVKVAFADPIKRAAMDWWDFSEEQLWGPSEMRNKPDERYPTERIIAMRALREENKITQQTLEDAYDVKPAFFLTPRHALQQIGTEVARSIDEGVWLRYGLKVARQLLQRPDKVNYKRTKGVVKEKRPTIAGVVLSDARFANELLHIREEGGKLIRIKRPGSGLSGVAATHASETEHQTWPDSDFDYCLENDGTLQDLPGKVKEMVETLLGAPEPPKQLELFR
jgi:hypothetical protein